MTGVRHVRAWVRVARRVPGYRPVRRRVLRTVRRGDLGREIARRAFPDLLDREEARRLRDSAVDRAVEKAVTAAVARERRRAREREQVQEQRRERGERARLRQEQARWEQRQERLRLAEQRSLPALSAGHLVAGELLGQRPLVVLDLRGVSARVAAAVVKEVAVEQLLGCAFRPLFVTDVADTTPLRRYGHVVEVIAPADRWSLPTPREDYVAERFEVIRREYDARWLVKVPPEGLTPTQRSHLRILGR